MQVMPPPAGFGKRKPFYHALFPFQVGHHFFDGDIVVRDGWRFAITGAA
jgi:hypothetical protein